jgi:hypothetical protein
MGGSLKSLGGDLDRRGMGRFGVAVLSHAALQQSTNYCAVHNDACVTVIAAQSGDCGKLAQQVFTLA